MALLCDGGGLRFVSSDLGVILAEEKLGAGEVGEKGSVVVVDCVMESSEGASVFVLFLSLEGGG